MARGTQLLQLITMLRDETGRSDSVAVGVDDVPQLKQALRRTQDVIYLQHDWPFLRTVFDRIPLQAGERFYDFPSGINLERIEEVVVWYGGIPTPLVRGVGTKEYAVYDSENDNRADPALRWDVRWTGSKEQCEIWPVPASTGNVALQFTGIRKLRALVNNSDVADLDDNLIVLTAAAQLLPKGSEVARAKADMASSLYNKLVGLSNANRQTYRMGSGPVDPVGSRVTVRVSR